jgi:trehalose 6-phosphate synthase/phosphatase
VLGSDVIGFHTRDYSRNFASAIRLLLGRGFPSTDRGVQPGASRLVTCPIGVDVSFFAGWARKPAVLAKAAEIRSQAAGPLFAGVDRLDYTKGIPERLLAFERLLELEPGLRGRARLIQIAVPSRDGVIGYGETRRTVESLVARINLRFARTDWSPIDYRYCSVDTETLVALYRAADVMLVTPLCDGMNLVAKEFVACREDEAGVLVLSSRAGAAAELHAAVTTDPHDGDDLVRAYRTAVTMPPAEQRARMRRLRLTVASHDSARWSRSFLDALGHREKLPLIA